MIMMAPATTLNTVRCESRNLPTEVAEAPRMMKTRENPTTKATELLKMRPTRAASPPALSSSIELPESMEIYPGTRGRTQGERKEATPAAKATGTLRSEK